MSREKQMIDEERWAIAKILAENFHINGEGWGESDFEWTAHCLQMAGYRKQSEGEWIAKEFDDGFGFKYKNYWCSVCGRKLVGYSDPKDAPYCHCGARMKGGK